MSGTLHELQTILNSYGIIISFSGYFSQGIIEEMSSAIKNHLENQETSKSDVYNVISVFVEQTQNIKNYAASKTGLIRDQISRSGIVIIGKNETGFFVNSGNLIANEDIPDLETRLQVIIKADKAELKRLYKERLRADVPEDSSGAGLGLLDIARKSNDILQYSFTPYGSQFHFFSLNAIL